MEDKKTVGNDPELKEIAERIRALAIKLGELSSRVEELNTRKEK